MYVFMYVCMYVMYVCMYACMYAYMYASMHVCMHVVVNVCMHACMYYSLKLAHVGALGFFSSTLHVLPVPSDFSNFALPVPMLNRFMKSIIFPCVLQGFLHRRWPKIALIFNLFSRRFQRPQNPQKMVPKRRLREPRMVPRGAQLASLGALGLC